MAEGKYAQYVNRLKTKGIVNPYYKKQLREPVFFDKTVYPQSPIDLRFLLIYGSGCGFGTGAPLQGNAGSLQMPKDTPHWHDCDEVFLFVGTDPHDLHDLRERWNSGWARGRRQRSMYSPSPQPSSFLSAWCTYPYTSEMSGNRSS